MKVFNLEKMALSLNVCSLPTNNLNMPPAKTNITNANSSVSTDSMRCSPGFPA